MFKKEAEEIVKRNVCGDCNKCQSFGYIGCDIYRYSKDSCLYGLRTGYNKANEWHYPSKGEYPKENILCLIQMKTGTFEIAYRVTDLSWKYKNTTFGCSFQSEIYAWKEIVLPELEESETC